MIWFLKFFPIGFLVTFNQPDALQFNVSELSIWRNEKIDFETEERVVLTPLPSQLWPEAPTGNSVVMYGKDAIFSSPYMNITKPKRR